MIAAQPDGPAKILVISEDWSSDCRRDVPMQFLAMQGSPFFDVWASARIDDILSALYGKSAVRR